MPSSVGHAFTALVIGAAIVPRPVPRRAQVAGVACAVLIDLDAIGRPFGYPDIAWLGGHRALTHSVFFAVATAAVVTAAGFRAPAWSGMRTRLFVFFALTMVAHAVLDSFASYGTGVTFFAPLSWRRFEAPWKVFDLWSELLLLWAPSYLFLRVVQRRDRAAMGRSDPPAG